jgi:hypothetical protein
MRSRPVRWLIGGVIVAVAAVAAAEPPSPAARKPRMHECCRIVELRQYTTYPGKRDALIGVFEREFVESQEAVGMQLVGQFRDVNDPNRFVWMRGFTDMPARAKALNAFYVGPVWKAHSKEANTTMYDSDNVLLLRPAREGSGFALGGRRRAAAGSRAPANTDFVVITTYHFKAPVADAFVAWFDEVLRPLFAGAGATVLAQLVTEPSENTFPQLPVRAGENVFVWVARFDSRLAYDQYLARLGTEPRWSGELFAALYKQIAGSPELLMLEPTPRSLVGHGATPAGP